MSDSVERLLVDFEGTALRVNRSHYVSAKTRQLREFGYADLTEEHVNEQVQAVLDGKTLEDGLTVIGGFIQGEVKKV